MVLPASDERRRRASARRERVCGAFGLVALICLMGAARAARAQQSSGDRISLDKLQIVSLGVSVGRVLPSQAEATGIYGVSADYGEVAHNWRVVFGATYWESRFRDHVIQTFVDTLNHNLLDSTGRARVLASPISIYDVTLSAEGRYTPTSPAALKPYIGFGLAAHVVNADGALINGTFVERSLDNISPGLFITGGVSLQILKHFGIEGGARADMLSSFRSAQVRASGAYYFGHLRGNRPTGGGGPS